MDLRSGLNPEQFRTLFQTPSSAAAYVASASGGGFDMVKELASAGMFMAEGAAQDGGSGYGELVDSLLATLRGMTKEEAKALQADEAQAKDKDPGALRARLKQAVADGWAVAAPLDGADGFARWVMELGRRTALTRTGGHFGIGNSSVIDE